MKTTASRALVVLVALGLFLPCGFAAEGALTSAEIRGIDQATARLAVLDKDLDGLRGQIEAARRFAPAVPSSIKEELARARPRVREAVSFVFGLHWRQVEPVLAAAHAAERKIADLEERVKAWSPSPAVPVRAVEAPTAAGTITGVVTDEATGSPLANVGIRVVGPTWSDATSDATGHWTITGLVAGTYYAVTTSVPAGYVREVFDNIACTSGCDAYSGTPIAVSESAVTSGVNFALERGGSVSGKVTAAATGLPTGGAVYLYDANGMSSYQYTDASGFYRFEGLPAGTYFAKTYSNYGSFADQLYDGILCEPTCTVTTGTPIVVAVGQEKGGIDFSLATFGAIQGRVTDSVTGFPLYGVSIATYASDGSIVGYGQSDQYGDYGVGGLVTGAHFVVASSPTYLDELYANRLCQSSCDPTTGTPVPVTLGSTTGSIDFVLDLGGGVAGRVTAAVTGVPVGSVEVDLYNSAGASAGYEVTSDLGYFVVSDLLPGSYFAWARRSSNHLGQLYNGLPCDPFCAVTGGTPIPVTSGVVTPGVNFSVTTLGTISGTLTAAGTGQPLSYRYVNVYDATGDYAGRGETNSVGAYKVTGLLAGAHFAWTDGGGGWVPGLYNGIQCPIPCTVTSGTPIDVVLGSEIGGINISLTALGGFSGSITDAATGAPLSSSHVGLHDATGRLVSTSYSDWSGRYAFGSLTAGTYFVSTVDNATYVEELYDNLDCGAPCDVTKGTPVVVALGAFRTDVDFKLHLPYFADVGLGHWARRYIEGAYVGGVTSGCGTNPLAYCPDVVVNRWQMAVFLARSIAGSDAAVPSSGTVPSVGPYDCAAGGVSLFPSDVPPTDGGCRHIHYIYSKGVTSGCGPGSFCPGGDTTRWQTAVFPAIALAGSDAAVPVSGTIPAVGDYNCVPGGTSLFPNDVPAMDGACRHVHYIYGQGLTAGCGPGSFCPSSTLTRDQMAVFLSKGFHLTKYGF